ncbi:MAG: histidine kinase [Gemmatimonadaceae bacterium]
MARRIGRHEHRLDGIERNWTAPGPSRVVTYTQLRPGHYTFHLRARNPGDVRNSDETSVAFDVMPAWYQTAWFTALIVLTIGVGGPLAFYSIGRSRSRMREERLRARFDAALEERTRVARELHDTLLQGFSGIALQLQATLLSNAQSPHETAERLTRTLILTDATLLDARRSIWDMRMPMLEEQDLASAIETSAKSAVVDSEIVLRVDVRGRSRRLTPLIESTMLRIGREAVVNAVRHGRPTSIGIELAYAEASVELQIRDDGCGFDPDEVDDATRIGHWGISGMRERAQHVGGSFEMRGAHGIGTVVSLVIPTANAGGDVA